MAIDNKYGQVFVPNSTIAEDEPVVVFRAQDATLPMLMTIYEQLCAQSGSPEKHLKLIRESRSVIEAWQAEHFTQIPQSKAYGG